MVGRITIKINTIVNTTTITNTIKIDSPGCLRWWPSHRPLQPVQSSIELNVKTLRSSNLNLVISSFNAINTMCRNLETLRSSGLNLVTSSSTSHLDSVVSSFTTSHSLRSLLSEIWVSSIYVLSLPFFYSGFYIWLFPVSQIYTRFGLFPMSSFQFEVCYYQKRYWC